MLLTLVLFGALAIALGGATLVALRARRVAARVAAALGAASGQDLVLAVTAARTARDRAVHEAETRRLELDQLTELLGVGVLRFDDELVLRAANAAAAAFLERSAGGLVGRSMMEVFADHEVEALIAAARDRGAASGEVAVHGEGGRTLALRARRSPAGAIWVVLDDVSELRRLQRIRTEFVDNLSHELRTPLTSVRLLTETLARDLRDAEVPERVRDRVARIDIETGHLVQMVSELLELSRIEGGQQLYLDPVNMVEVVRTSCDRLRLFAERQGVGLEIVLPSNLPLVRGDAERLGQVLLNLVHNALKFSPPGTTVTVRAATTTGQLEVVVADEGPGIPKSDQARIFERFYKVDRARLRGMGGTGLGLAIARHVVEGHGGRLWLDSEEGRGSTFSFSLPIAGDVTAASEPLVARR